MSFHALNRFYLLISLALSLTIPLLSYERTEIVILEPQPIQETTFADEEIKKSTNNQVSTIQPPAIIKESPQAEIDWIQMLNVIYLVGVGVMFFLFLKNILSIFYGIKKASSSADSTSPSHQNIKKLKILLTKKQSNSSFFNYVFLNPDKLTPHEQALIIAHESFHAQRLHTLDLLLLGILKVIFWFNPIIYFYQKSLKQLHEYEVDALMSATHDSREYAHLLLKLSVAPNAMLTNQFSTKPLFERIQFLFKTPTKNMKKLLYFLSLPIIAVGVMAFAEEKVNTIYKQKNSGKIIQSIDVKNDISKNDTLKKTKIVLDTLTQDFVSQNDSSKFCRPINFTLNLEKVDSVTIIAEGQMLIKGKDFLTKDNSILLDKKYEKRKVTIRVHSSYNIGGPGSYYLYPNLTKLEKNTYLIFDKIKTLPIFTTSRDSKIMPQFTLSSKLPKTPTPFSNIAKNQDTLRTILETNKLGENPLVIINRVEYPSSILYRINPEAIDSQDISSQKDKNTVLFYGEKAKDGCIEKKKKKGIDIFLKDNEKRKSILENVAKQIQESQKRVKREFTKEADGEYEKISIMRLNSDKFHASVKFPKGSTALFILDGEIVNEKEVANSNKVFVSVRASSQSDKDIMEKFGEELKKYDTYFVIKTKQD